MHALPKSERTKQIPQLSYHFPFPNQELPPAATALCFNFASLSLQKKTTTTKTKTKGASFQLRSLVSELPVEGQILPFEVVFDAPPGVNVSIHVASTNQTTVQDPVLSINDANWNTSVHRFFAGATQNNYIQSSPFSIPLQLRILTPVSDANVTLDIAAIDSNTGLSCFGWPGEGDV